MGRVCISLDAATSSAEGAEAMTTEAERLADELMNPAGLSFPRAQAAAIKQHLGEV